MIYDTFSFFNELDLLEIRLNILDEYVDFFVIVESSYTFSGLKKPLYFKENQERYSKWKDKIIHYIVDDYPKNNRIMELAKQRKGLVSDGLDHYLRAFYQKESIKDVLVNLKDDDIVYYGDLDEIWKPKEIDGGIYKLKQLGYSYYLNNRSSEQWTGTVVTKYKNIKENCLNDLRANTTSFLEDGGWHFTNMGGLEALKSKLEAYDHQEFNNEEIKSKLLDNLDSNKDYLGRNRDYLGKKLTFWTDESELPSFILQNKDRYKHLFNYKDRKVSKFKKLLYRLDTILIYPIIKVLKRILKKVTKIFYKI